MTWCRRVAGAKHRDSLWVYDIDGLDANIVFTDRTSADLTRFGPDGSVSVFRTLTVLPGLSDWTDRPLR